MTRPFRGGTGLAIAAALATAAAPRDGGAFGTTRRNADASVSTDADGEAPPRSPGSPGVDEPPEATPATSGSVAGPTVDPEEARRARADLDGSPGSSADSDVPQRMPPLQAGAWWTLFAAIGVATTAGILGGLAEVEEDRATRIASEYDPETGMLPLYEDRKDDYERALHRGERMQWAAWGLLAASGVMVVISGGLFIARARRDRADRRRARFAPGLLEVRF